MQFDIILLQNGCTGHSEHQLDDVRKAICKSKEKRKVMCQVMIHIPNEVLYYAHMRVDEATAFARQMVALGYYTHKQVSIGYCAQMAAMTEEEFIIFLGRNHIDIFRFDDDQELMRDFANA